MHRDDLAESMLSTVSRFYYIRLREMIWNIHDTLWYKRRNDRNEIVANFKSLSIRLSVKWQESFDLSVHCESKESKLLHDFCIISFIESNNLLSLFASFVVEENIFIIASSDTKQNGKWLDTFASSQSVVFQISAVLFYLSISLSILSFLRIRERARPMQINAATRLWIPLRMH